MKLKDFKQAMDWRRRVGFNGGGYVRAKFANGKRVLPKKKPEEEAEKVNKARKEKTFEKAKPALENPKEVKEMIDKPKRGLVDEPGSYAGEGITVTEVNKYRKQGLTAKEIIKKLSESLDRNVNLSEYEKFLTANKSKLVKVIPQKITKERKKFLDKAAKKKGYKNYASVTDQAERELIGSDATRRQKGVLEGKGGIGYDKTPANDPTRFKEIKKFVNDTKKTFGYLPTKSEIKNYFEETKGSKYVSQVEHYVKKTKIKLPTGISGGPRVNVDARIKKLLNSKTITNILDAGGFPTNSIIKNILKVDPTTAGDTAFDLAKTLSGEKHIRLFNAPTKYKKIAEKYVAENRGNIFTPRKRATKERSYYEKGLTKLLNLPKNIALIRQDIVDKLKKIIPDMKNLSVDEIGSITTSMRSGSGPYAIFGQVIDKDFNILKGSTMDASKGRLEKKLINLSKDDPERLKLKTNYNNYVNEFELKANKNNPIKKVKGLKLSFKPPSETVKNKKVYNQYKDLFDAHYDKYGYSFEVPADRDSIVDISKKLDNKAFQSTVKNRFKTLLGKGGKFGALIGAGTLVGTGFAFADQPNTQEATSVLPTAAAAGTGAATVGTKTGRDILGKAFRTLGTPLAGAGFAGTDVYSKMKEGQSLADAVVDPITGLELSFPGLFKENISKITKSPTLQKILGLGRFGRALTPVGLGLATLGQAQEFYNQYQDLQRMKEQNPRAYSEFMESRQTPALSAAEQTAVEDMGRSGAAGGGIMKMAGKPSGPPPESGPIPQGLDFLLNRGRKR